MKKFGLLFTGALAVAAVATAQPPAPLDVEIAMTGATIDGLNGASADAELDGVAVHPNESAFYVFDSIGSMDGIITSVGPAVFATEAQIAGGAASAGDLDADASNLYVSTFDNSKQRIWRIPSTGFGTAAEMVDSSGSATANMDEIEVDGDNSRLIISYNDAFGAVAEDIVHVALAATAAAPTAFVTEAQLEAVLATITGYVDDTSDDLNVHDLTVQSDGDIIASHGFTSTRQINGSLLRITDTGTISVFRTADQIISAAGLDPNLVNIGSVNVEALSDDQILIHVQFSSDNNVLQPFIGVVSADGASQRVLATQSQLAGDSDITLTLLPAGQDFFEMDGKGGDVAADDDYYFYRQGQGSLAAENAVLRLTGIRTLLDQTAASDWEMFE